MTRRSTSHPAESSLLRCSRTLASLGLVGALGLAAGRPVAAQGVEPPPPEPAPEQQDQPAPQPLPAPTAPTDREGVDPSPAALQDPAPVAGSDEPKPEPETPTGEDGVPPAADRSPGTPSPESVEGAVAPESEKLPEAVRTATWEPRYHELAEVAALLDAWRSRTPEGVVLEALDLGTSFGGHVVPAIQFGRASGAKGGAAGAADLEQRPTVILLGGLDGVSLAGSEGVLAAVSGLLARPADLPPGVTFIAIPWAAPDGLMATALRGGTRGCNARPTDDDHDGLIDEDRPDDLDGDGLILELLVQEPAGPWVRVEGTRFLARAREGEAPRYRLVPEGRDDDGDGRFNEDDLGGVCLDANFPVGWRGGWSGTPGGTAPLSEPLARSYANLALARKTSAVLLFQGNHGGLAKPGGTPSEELGWELPAASHGAVFDRLAEDFHRATGRPLQPAASLRAARGSVRPGAAIDWFYGSVGALSAEVAVWGPEYERASQDAAGRGPRAMDARFARGLRSASEAADESEAEDGRTEGRVSAVDRRWADWLDNTRGGLGFVDWHPVDLGAGRKGFVGGWRPRTRINPPVEELERATAGLAAFVLDLSRALPQLEIEVQHVQRNGELCRLRARVRNRGVVPSGLLPGAVPGSAPEGLVLEFIVTGDAELLAGPRRTSFGHLPGGGVSEEVEWLVRAPEGATLRLLAEDRLAAPVTIEVQP